MNMLTPCLGLAESAAWQQPNLAAGAAMSCVALAVFWLIGLALVPARWSGGERLLLLSLRLVSGMLFAAGVIAAVTMGRGSYLSVTPLIQIAAVIVLRKPRAPDQSVVVTDKWRPLQAASTALVTAAFVAAFALPGRFVSGDGTYRDIYEDQGYYVQQVLGIPESRAATIWSGVLGSQAAEAGESRDVWYHWGAIIVAIGVKALSGLSAMTALQGTMRWALDAMLLLAAGASVKRLCRVPDAAAVALGGLSLLAGQLIKTNDVQALMAALPYGGSQHFRPSLVLWFSYKYEGVILLTAIAAWIHRQGAAAILLLSCAAASSPHSFASVGAAAGAFGALGLVLRDARAWRTAALGIAALLAGGAVALLCGGSLAKAEGQSVIGFDVASLAAAIARGSVDSLAGLALGAVSLPGIIFLIRRRADDHPEEARQLGLLALAGTAGVYAAYHLFAGMPDGYHFIYFFHAIVVVPAGLWGAICMARHGAGTRVRSLGLAAAAAMAVTGVHDMVAFHNRRLDTMWRPSDLATIHAELNGRPFGYFASSDRGWWIPMRAVLGSLLDSRCVRLSVIDERHRDASRYYGFGAPFALVPPKRGENPDAWSLRFARKLGIRHVISTPENPVPAKVRARCKPVASAPGLMLYELPEAPDPGLQALPQPAAQTAAQAAAPRS